ncbi:MAG: hypothetical protein LUG65_05995, partial [Clostridiales bacterium]|nr:hypothetical protein [Clostridiales bacterium]
LSGAGGVPRGGSRHFGQSGPLPEGGMLTRQTPPGWRKGYALHRRRTRTDGYGETAAYYDMDTPDLEVADGADNCICWQDVRTWQTGGELNSGSSIQESGESARGVLQGVVFGALEVEPFDRFVIDGKVYELRTVQRWLGYRLLQLQRMF